MNEVHSGGVNAYMLCTERNDGCRRSIHAHEVNMHVAMFTECSHDGERLCQRPAQRVNEHMHLGIGILCQDVVHIIAVEVVASDISFQVKMILVLSHRKGVLMRYWHKSTPL